VNKKQSELLRTMLDDMVIDFRDVFFRKYLTNIDKLDQKDAEAISLNLIFSFAVSAFVNVVMPILMSSNDKEKAIVDSERLLGDIRKTILAGLKGHTPIGRVIN
jgi:hypothetical protein